MHRRATPASKKKTLSGVMQQMLQARQEFVNSVYEVADAIIQLPENPNIHEIKGSCLMFVVRLKDLGGLWTPQYLSFRYQYNVIAEHFRTDPLHALDWWLVKRKLGKIIRYKYHYDPWSGRMINCGRDYEVQLHPEVIKHVDEFLGITGEENE